jgi:hypothetical protein
MTLNKKCSSAARIFGGYDRDILENRTKFFAGNLPGKLLMMTSVLK